MKKIYLKNNVPMILKINKKTPRIALCLYLSINEPEKNAGVYTLLNRLFMQGTKNRTAQQLAQELEENAIECYCEMKQDFFRFRLLCLNEDFAHALEILKDIVFNSHFNEFDKEVVKLKGEIEADLDSPKTRAMDNYYKTIFENHFYGNSHTKILENVDTITQQDIITAYETVMQSSNKVVTLVGDVDEQDMVEKLNASFADLRLEKDNSSKISIPTLDNKKVSTIEKSDAKQAQIIQGWIVPTVYDADYPSIVLLNTILGSSGLSSRLFVELRDKKGLAYTVRSSYETYLKAGVFSVYIGTEPKNIAVSLEGFKQEIDKLKNTLVSDKELFDAKNNLIGKRQFLTETNSSQSSLIGLYEIQNLGYDYEDELIRKIKKVTSEDILRVTKKYLGESYVLSILAPEKYLNF